MRVESGPSGRRTPKSLRPETPWRLQAAANTVYHTHATCQRVGLKPYAIAALMMRMWYSVGMERQGKLNLTQVARRVGVDRQTVIAAIARGDLRAEQVRLGNQVLWCITLEDCDAWRKARHQLRLAAKGLAAKGAEEENE